MALVLNTKTSFLKSPLIYSHRNLFFDWRLLAAFLLILLMLIFSSAPEAAGSNTPGVRTNPSSHSDYQDFGETFAQALQTYDMDKLSKLYDIERFARRVAALVVEKPSEQNDFAKGFLKNRENIMDNLFSEIPRSKPAIKFLRTANFEGVLKPLIRLDFPNGGHEYILLTMHRKRNNDLVAVDMFLATTGKKSSQSIAEATQLMIKPNKTMLAKLLNIKSLDKSMTDKFQMIGALKRQGKHSEAYDLISKLPENIRRSRVILDLSVGLAQTISDEEYKKQLGLLAKYHGNDDSTLFMLIDYYMYQKNYKKMAEGIDRMMQLFGEDAALYNLKTSTALLANDTNAATRFARKAIRLEHDFISAHWSLIAALNAGQQYSEMVSAFKTIEKTFGYQFSADNFAGDEFYSSFVQSEAFKGWLN